MIKLCESKKLDVDAREVILTYGDDGWWTVECPSLPGCVSQGETQEEAIFNIREAIAGYIEALEELEFRPS